MKPDISLYNCEVMHQRNFPMRYQFTYRVYSFLLDIDQLDELAKKPLVSVNRFNLFSIYQKDHGSRDGRPWRQWIDPLLDSHGLSCGKSKIRLLCFPRILGYAFNPLNLWFCYDRKEHLQAVICEVSNTFGEFHHYVLPNLANQTDPGEGPQTLRAVKDKLFHVSPFIDMNQQYRFAISSPGKKLKIHIHEYKNDELMLVATQNGTKVPFSTSRLLTNFILMPLMTSKIMLLIHWQALKIWLKGGKFHPKPAQSRTRIS